MERGSLTLAVNDRRSSHAEPTTQPSSLFTYCLRQTEIIPLCLSWYLRYSSNYRGLKEIVIQQGFFVDYTTICPQGPVWRYWNEVPRPNGKPIIQVQFNTEECRQCDVRERCNRRKDQGQELTLKPQAEQEAIKSARQRQQTHEFKQAYAIRVGVEGTTSGAAVAHEMRRARYVGEKKTHLLSPLPIKSRHFLLTPAQLFILHRRHPLSHQHRGCRPAVGRPGRYPW